jgi:hypothetical protein
MKSVEKTAIRSLRLAVRLAPALFCLPLICRAPVENGIHVGEPKIYDTRSLTLMLDALADSLRKNTSFIDPKALAQALGNLQGFSSQDFSQAFSANGAVGPNAASVFSGANAAANATPATATTTTPNVSITVSPTLNAAAPATAAPASAATPPGPAAPALPALQTPPNFTPNFGENAGDLLSDEVNLTYQYDNIRMMLEQSLTDRIQNGQARLQAVVGFDIDIEPMDSAKDAAATVEITLSVSDCGKLPPAECAAAPLSLVAIMPEEGSHNAATLSQKANAFGGALASAVYSVGYSVQKRSQVFYLYRDMDTVSYQKPGGDAQTMVFGWQFRPVLGRHSVAAGTRHMLAVLALPAQDLGNAAKLDPPHLSAKVNTYWTRYDGSSQTTDKKLGFWAKLTTPALPDHSQLTYDNVKVFTTAASQSELKPRVAGVKWVRTDANSGVAIVTGENFFPQTTVRLGGKLYATPADGLVIKSDQQLELTAPVISATTRGVLSGRYGEAKPLEALPDGLPTGFTIGSIRLSPTGTDAYELDAQLQFYGKITERDLRANANAPIISVNSTPVSTPFYYQSVYLPKKPGEKDAKTDPTRLRLTTFVPAPLVKTGAAVTITYPFHGPTWTASIVHYDATAKVTRLGGATDSRLLISTTDRTMQICGVLDATGKIVNKWKLQLDDTLEWTPADKTQLTCPDANAPLFQLDIPTAKLKPYKHFVLFDPSGDFPPLVGDIPTADTPPPAPSLDKDQKVSVTQYDITLVTFKGTNLDQVKNVLFAAADLKFKAADDGKSIAISLDKTVTDEPRNADLQLISPGNDPVKASLVITPAPAGQKGK